VKFLLDVCAGGRLRLWLERRGHDVAEVRRRSPSLGDSDVVAWAWEEERIIITVDKDFGELAVAKGQPHCGIIRLPDLPFNERVALLEHILLRFGDALAKGCIVTASRTRIHVRRPGSP